MESSTALSILTLLSISTAAAQVSTREDGKCGVIDGVETGCEHIPPFPTCCQENGHCGWDCDGSETNQLCTYDVCISFGLLIPLSAFHATYQYCSSAKLSNSPTPRADIICT